MIDFSIIVPVYNVAQWLERCLRSIVLQTHSNYEVILVNDGSDDGSLEICEQYAKSDSRFCILNEQHLGPAGARNRGLSVSKGEYVVFVDSDDEIDKDYLSVLYKKKNIAKPDICFFSCHYVVEYSRKVVYWPIHDFDDQKLYTSAEFLKKCVRQNEGIPSSTWLMAFKRELQNQYEIYMDETLEWSEDADFAYHLFAFSKTIAICNTPGYYWHRDNGPTLSDSVNFSRLSSRMDVFKKWSCYYMNTDCFLEGFEKEVLVRFGEWLRDVYCNYLFSVGIMGNKSMDEALQKKLLDDREFWCKSQRKDIWIYKFWGIRIGKFYNIIRKLISKFIGFLKK